METVVVIVIGVVFIVILLILSPKIQEDIDKLHSKKTECIKITCSEFLRVLEENPDKELVITIKTFTGGGEFGGYYEKDTKKLSEIEVTDTEVKITYQ